MTSENPRDFMKATFNLKETSCNIISDEKDAINSAMSSIKTHRKELEKHIEKHPKFPYFLRPAPITKCPEIVRLMVEATTPAGVGPMAAVAGVLADLAVKDMVKKGAKVAVVENGGEAAAFSDKPLNVALQAGDSLLSRRIGFRLEKFPIGVATSSGLYSHALSFGEAEAVTIFAVNAGIADAVATAVGNIIKGDDHKAVIEKGVEKALSIEGVDGLFIIYKGMVGLGGEVPTIIGVNPESNSVKPLNVSYA